MLGEAAKRWVRFSPCARYQGYFDAKRAQSRQTHSGTWLFSFVTRNAPAPALASGFVLAVWAILLLGWINPRFVGQPAPSETEATSTR
jgi:hypothetical protein